MRQTKISALPRSIACYKFQDVVFSVFLVKDFFSPKWKSLKLLKVLKRARSSYKIYGNVSLLDEFDGKSLIYLIRAAYNHLDKGNKMEVEEWISLRFTPGGGTPETTEDILRMRYNNKPLIELIKNNSTDPSNIIKRFVSLSRFCRIPPVCVIKSNAKKFQIKSNKYTLASFIILNLEFFKNQNKYGPFSYITGLFRRDLLSKKLLVKFNGKNYPQFIAAHKTFKTKKGSLRLNRDGFSYSYPGYFLNLKHLNILFKRAVNTGELKLKTFEHYLKIPKLKNFSELKLREHIHLLGNILKEKSNIKHSPIEAGKLRNMIAERVGDGPEFMAMPINTWEKDINLIFSKLQDII